MGVATAWHGFMPYQTWSGVFRDSTWTARDIRNFTSCGIFSLHHAMVFLGQGHNFQLLRSKHRALLKLLLTGTDTGELISLAKAHKLRTSVFESRSASAIRRKVDASLKAGHPVIIGSEPQVHWICLGGRTDDGGYVWADSGSDPAVGAFRSWDEIEDWMTFDEEEEYYPELEFPFEIIAVSPGKGMPASRTMVPWVGSLSKILAADSDYAGDWSNLLADMLDVFWDLDYAPKGRPAGEFLDEHLGGIVDSVASATGHSRAVILEIGRGYRDAADFHSLVAPKGEETSVIAAFSLKLLMKGIR